MLQKICISLSLVSVVLFTGCGQKEVVIPKDKKTQMIESTNSLPSWITNSKIDNGIAAVGLTGYSKHGIEVMLPQAEMDGRVKLAGQIQTIVSDLKEKSLRHNKIDQLDNFETAFKVGSKEVISKIPLSGARRIAMFQAKDGTLYVHMVIEKRAVASNLKNMKSVYKEQMEASDMTRKSIDQGMKVLDDMMNELDKELN